MSDIRRLYQLQLLDLEITVRSVEQRGLEERLQGWAELDESVARRDEARGALIVLEREQRDFQGEVDVAAAKLTREEQRLYGGEIRNPRELTDLQREVQSLQAQRADKDEQLLELLVRVDEARAHLRDEEAKAGELEARWAAMTQEMRTQLTAVTATLAQLDAQRTQVTQGVEASSLRLYDTLRAGRNGLAVARVEQSRCQGCRVELPAAVLQRVRQDRQLSQCNHCNRLLYLM